METVAPRFSMHDLGGGLEWKQPLFNFQIGRIPPTFIGECSSMSVTILSAALPLMFLHNTARKRNFSPNSCPIRPQNFPDATSRPTKTHDSCPNWSLRICRVNSTFHLSIHS